MYHHLLALMIGLGWLSEPSAEGPGPTPDVGVTTARIAAVLRYIGRV